MTDTKIDTNKLIGGMGAVSLVLGGIVWQNLNSSISNIAVELKETATELKEITTDLKRDLQETNRTIGQMKEDLAVVRPSWNMFRRVRRRWIGHHLSRHVV